MTLVFYLFTKLLKGNSFVEIWDDEVSFNVSPILSTVGSQALQVWCLFNLAFVGISNEFWFTFLEKPCSFQFYFPTGRGEVSYVEMRYISYARWSDAAKYN